MNKKTRSLLNENNAYEKSNLSDLSKNVMTDIVCYLRGSNLSEYNQEVVRRDINYMLVDGEGRGETPESIIGSDYQLFCDEIIKSFPERTKSEKLMSEVNETTGAISVIAFIWLIGKIVKAVIQNTSLFQLNITLGEIIGSIVLVLDAKIILDYITHRVFLESNKPESKFTNYLLLWMKLTILLSIPMLFLILLKSPEYPIVLPVAVAIVIIPLLVGFVLDRIDS
jgi:DNA-binding ferritin-like protein (Dps family)